MFHQPVSMNTTRLLFAVACLLGLQSQAQTWPVEMRISDDGHMLNIGGAQSHGLYNDSLVRSFYLTFSQPNYWSQLQANYASKTNLPATLVVDGVTYDSVGVRFKGQTSYSMAGSTEKKSFNISTDFIHSSQDLMGYKTMNLNNCFGDESFLREVFYQHQIRKHIPSAKSAFVKLYINGENWGVYPHVQQLNKQFLKEWFMTNNGTNWRCDAPAGTGGGGPGGPSWGDGTAAINYLGEDTTDYQQYYTLKSTDETNPWQFLVDASRALDTVSDAHMEDVLNNYFDVDRTLWYLASEIEFSDDDGYVYKGKMDYYVYHEAETGRMVPLEYDGNSVMESSHVTWSPFYHADQENYPLLYRMLANASLRQRYLAHMRTIIEEELDVTECNAKLDEYQALIDTMVQNDPKKIYTYNQFVTEVNNLKSFINTRRNNLLANAEVAEVGPSISAAAHYADNTAWQQPQPMQNVVVKTTVASTNGISGVTLYYSNSIVGKFFKTQMFDDGMHDDGAASDGIYGANIPGQTAGTWVRWYVEAASNNSAKSVSYMPAGAEHNVYIYQVADPLSVENINTEASFNIYPNPASDVVYIKVNGATNDLVEIVNAVGQIVYSKKAIGTVNIETSELIDGLYFVRVGTTTKKLVIAH